MDLNPVQAIWHAWRGPRIPSSPSPIRRRALAKGLLLGFLGLDLALLCGFGGRQFGQALTAADPEALGLRLGRIPLALGLAGALWEGGCLLSSRPFRPLFVRTRTLLLAELALGLTTPVKAVLAGLGLAFTLGLASVHPGLAPWFLSWVPQVLLWTVCLERVGSAWSPLGLLRQGVLLVWLGLLALLWMVLLSTGHLPPLAGVLGGAGRALGRAAALPSLQIVAACQAELTHRPLAALGHLASSWGLTLSGLALTAWPLARTLREGPSRPASLGAGKPWRFQRAWAGVARLQFHQLLGSRAGQLRLFAVFLSLLMMKEPELLTVGTLHAPRAWILASLAFTFGTVLTVPLCNLLGLDRGGVRTWWLLPLEDRDLLLGKVLGVAAYAALLVPALLLMQRAHLAWSLQRGAGDALAWTATPRGWAPLEGISATLFLLALFLWIAGTGLGRSLRSASPMHLGSYGVHLDFDDEKLARLGAVVLPLLWMVPLYGLSARWGRAVQWPCLVLLIALASWRFAACLDRACRTLEANREALTATLCAAG